MVFVQFQAIQDTPLMNTGPLFRLISEALSLKTIVLGKIPSILYQRLDTVITPSNFVMMGNRGEYLYTHWFSLRLLVHVQVEWSVDISTETELTTTYQILLGEPAPKTLKTNSCMVRTVEAREVA